MLYYLYIYVVIYKIYKIYKVSFLYFLDNELLYTNVQVAAVHAYISCVFNVPLSVISSIFFKLSSYI